MPNNENVTTKFKVDISDLKKNISAANAAVRQYRAELKNADAGMEKGEKTVDSLSRKIEAQSKIVEQEQAKLDALKDELKRYEETVQKGETIIADLTEKHKKAAEQYGETSDEAKKYAKELREAQAAQERNTKKVDELRTAIINQDTVLKNSQHQVDVYKSDLDELGKSEKEVGDEAEKTTNGGLSAFGVALGNLADNVISNLVSKLGELITQTVKTGAAFEQSMSKVQAISGATNEDMDRLNDTAKKLGESTQFTASQVGDAMSYMAMAGWKTEDMLGGIDGVLDLAAASGADLATTSDIVTDALTAFGESAGEAGRLADIMAVTASNANTNVELMGETFKYVAPLAGSMGYTMEDMSVAIGLMANSGIKGTQAGTSLRAMITRLASPTKESMQAMSELGIEIEKVNEDGTKELKSFGETVGELREIFGSINMPVDELTQKLSTLEIQQAAYDDALAAGEMTQAQYEKKTGELAKSQAELMKRAYGAEGALKAQYASMLAGKNGLSGFLALVNSSDEDFEKLTKAVNESEGAAAQMADTMTNNLTGDITRLQSAFEGLQIAIFEKLDVPLRDLVQTVTNDVIPLIKDVINGVTGASTRLVNHLSDIINDFLEKTVEFLPKVFDFGGDLISKLLDGIIAAAPKLIDSAGAIIENLLDGLLAELPKIVTGVANIAAKILEKLAELIPTIAKSLLKALPKIVKALSDALPILIQAASSFMQELIAALPEVVQMLAAELPDIIKTIADTITEQLPILLDAAFEIFNALVEAVPLVLPPLVEALPQIIDTVIKFLTDNTQTLLEAFIKAFKVGLQAIPVLVESLVPLLPDIIDAVVHGLLDAAPEIFEAAKTVFFEIANAIMDFAKQLPEYVYRLLEPIYDNFIDPLKEGLKEFWDWFKNLEFFDEVGDTIGSIVDTFSEGINKIKGFFSGLWDSIKETFHSIGEFFGGIWDDIKKTFTTIGTKIGDAIGGAFKTAINAVLETVENAINSVPEAINNAIDLLNELPGVDIGSMDYISLPRLAKGGIVDRSTLAMVGESGREAILPLENNKAALKEIAALIADEMNVGTATQRVNTQPVVNNYNFSQTNNSPKALSRWDIYRQTKNLIRNLKNEGAIPNV